MPKKYDFAGYVTKNDVKCSDGLVIKHDAFASQSGQVVPLVWQHQHNDSGNVLGHMVLKNVNNGVYGYGSFNDTESASNAKLAVEHGDINSMSIYANRIQKVGSDVVHGNIIEVSLVLAGANPGAQIDEIVEHSGEDSMSAIIYPDTLIHSEKDELDDGEGDKSMNDEDKKPETEEPKEPETPKTEEDTVGKVYDSLSDEQKKVVEFLIAEALQSEPTGEQGEPGESGEPATDVQHSQEEKEDADMPKTNVFAQNEDTETNVISHDQLNEVLADAKTIGTLKDSYIQHSITNIETLFPEAVNLNKTPVIYRDTNTSATEIMAAIRKSPFSRVKTTVADLTGDEARARGYIKGNEKLEQIYKVMHRETTPQTVYKKQKLDRDDIIDITDFDVVAFTQTEMRFMLDEELARAAMVGDGRAVSDASKIKEDSIRPIMTDDDFYTIKTVVPTLDDLLESIILAMGDYKGSGSPALYINPKLLARFKLLKATDGRYLFNNDIPSDASMAARLGVSKIVPTTFFKEDQALIVNLGDYQFGASKGGQVTTFDDFDIDFNQYKYLIETRVSGALTLPKAAIAISVTDQVSQKAPKAPKA